MDNLCLRKRNQCSEQSSDEIYLLILIYGLLSYTRIDIWLLWPQFWLANEQNLITCFVLYWAIFSFTLNRMFAVTSAAARQTLQAATEPQSNTTKHINSNNYTWPDISRTAPHTDRGIRFILRSVLACSWVAIGVNVRRQSSTIVVKLADSVWVSVPLCCTINCCCIWAFLLCI